LFEWRLIKVLLCDVLGRVDVLGFLLTKDIYSFKTIFGKNMNNGDTENYLGARTLLIDAQQQS